MHFKYFSLLALFFLSCGSGTIGKEDLKTKQILVPLADPFILLYNDLYYAYGTGAEDGIEVIYKLCWF